jgi:hypothetical protein
VSIDRALDLPFPERNLGKKDDDDDDDDVMMMMMMMIMS